MNFNEEFYNNDKKDKIFVSLGNYCLTSMLLKENNLKFESHPFDWMVSCIENIIHIFENNFEEFLNKKNYIVPVENQTKNLLYQPNTKILFSQIDSDHQHHNLLLEQNYLYLYRTVERIKNLHLRYKKIIFIMIQPLYQNNLSVDLDKIKKLYNILLDKNGDKIKLIIFNIVKEKNENFNKEYINENLIIVELDTNMVIGNYGMMYFDNNGINKFLEIINEI
jgi:hypothetical protein